MSNSSLSSNRFEDLGAWQKARDLAAAIYETIRERGSEGDYGLATQMQRAAVSIMAGIEEGLNQQSTSDFHRCLVIARASCSEIRSQLHMALDIGFIDKSRFDKLMLQTAEISQVLNGMRASEFGIGVADLEPVKPHPG